MCNNGLQEADDDYSVIVTKPDSITYYCTDLIVYDAVQRPWSLGDSMGVDSFIILPSPNIKKIVHYERMAAPLAVPVTDCTYCGGDKLFYMNYK